MRRRRKKGIAALLLALCVTLGLLPALTVPANAATNVSYLDASGATQTAASATSVTSSSTTWSAGWYVVDSDVAISSRITVTGDVHLILADDKTLNASAGIGVSASDNASLTIYGQAEGTGALSATGGSKYAGIGSGNGTNGGNGAAGIITVNGGAVTANGGSQSAGIGGGPYGAGGNITINGGTVTANGGLYSAGIGGGPYGAGGNITINGGTVNANGNVKGGRSDGGAGIGGGENGNNSGAGNSISITGGTVTATVPNGTKGAAIGNGGGDSGTDVTVTIGAGLTVGAGTSADGTGATSTTAADVANNKSYKYAKIPFAAVPLDPVSYLDWDDAEKKLVEKKGDDACKDYALVTANDTAWGAANATKWYVVNSDVTIASRITVTGDVHLILADNCTLTASAGITVTGSNSLTIYAQSTGDSMGRLSATGGEYGAGIGGCNGAGGVITINGGAVTANGGDYGAGIGGCNGAGGTITVNGGAVTANGGKYGAGIGGGSDGAGGTITVNGGAVTANGGAQGAGIGGGYNGAGGEITVNGGAVTATGGAQGAGIGGGIEGAGGEITVNGGAVTANGGTYSAGIGGGCQGASGAISITGGTVNANGNVGGSGGDGGAGIGGGESGNNSGDGNSISITGGIVTATVPNGTKGAAIGNGGGSSGTNVNSVTIGAGATVEAGTSADGTGAEVKTDAPNNKDYKYAKITFAAAPSYTVTAADMVTETDKKYHYNEDITIAVTVSGADFEGGEFTLNYDSNTLAVKTLPTNNLIAASEQETGKIKFEAKEKTTKTNGTALAVIVFTVNAKVTTETTCNFTFEGTPKICYDMGENSVAAATATPGSVTVEPITYAVTLTGNDGVTFVNASSQTITTDTAIDGQDYSVNIKDYSAVDYEYAVTLAVEGTDGTTTLTPSDAITVEAAKVTGNLTITVTRTTKHVTATLTASPAGDFTLSGVTTKPDNTTVTDAIKGLNYVVTIGGYSATDYEYAVTLAVEGTEGTTTLTPSDAGVITVEAAKVTGNLTVTVTRTTKHVTATLTANPTGEFTLSGVTTKPDNTTVTDAIKGLNYVVTISDYDAANYAYAVTLTMNGASATAPTPDTDGKLTIEGANITGNFTLTVTKTLANFTVTTTADYVTGWTLVTVAKASGRTDNPIYNYDGNATYYVNAYNAYAYLVNSAVTEDEAKAKVSLGTSAAGTIAAGYDVNNTGKVDYSDALLTYRCYEMVYQTPATAMETYLRADADGSKKVDTTDVSAIDGNRTAESA